MNHCKLFIYLVLLTLMFSCTSYRDMKPTDIKYPTERITPTVKWAFMPYDSICGTRLIPRSELYIHPFYDGEGREIDIRPSVKFFIGGIEKNDTTVQIWRIEWAPVASGDSCFVPIAYPILHHGIPAGLMAFTIENIAVATDSTPGDWVMVWRSWPPPEYEVSVPSGFCMKYKR